MAYFCKRNIVDMHPYAICEDVYGKTVRRYFL